MSFKSVCFLTLIFMVQACDNEFSEIGTGIVGIPGFEIQNSTYPIKTYNKKITPFQSNGLAENLLGYYFDPLFGSTKVNFVGQLTPKSFNPVFGDSTVLDSVVLTIPYTSTAGTTEDATTYELDSLYGGTESDKLKLSIFKSNYYLRAFDPNGDLDASQNYYSNGDLTQGETIGADLEGPLLYYSNNYLPKANPIGLKEINEETDELEVTSTIPPSFRVHLFSPTGQNSNPTAAFWEDLIFSKEEDAVLSDTNSFYEYFRGLYFKIEPNSVESKNLIQLNFSSSNANVKMYYSYKQTTTVEGVETTTSVQGEYEMSFLGNRVNIFDNDFNASVLQTINDSSTDDVGDDYLYLKGGEGSMAVVELISEGGDETTETNQFNEFKNEFREVNNGVKTVKRLINEAYIEFYVETTLSNSVLPNRVYLYDLNNNLPMADFFLDQTVNTSSSDSKFTHLVPLSTETNTDGTEQKKYKIRLTEHLNNIILNDSTNVKLGLVVSSNVGAANTKAFQNGIDLNNTIIKGVPTGTILSPKSVILHGNNSSDPTKRPKLNIYYTEPNTGSSN